MELDPSDLEEIANLFRDDSRERLINMEEALLALEASPGDQENLMTIYRIAHNLKGSAGVLGFKTVSEFAHALEDLLRGIQDGIAPVTKELITLLLQSVDVLSSLIKASFEGPSVLSPEQLGLLRRLRSLCAREDSDYSRPFAKSAPAAVDSPASAAILAENRRPEIEMEPPEKKATV